MPSGTWVVAAFLILNGIYADVFLGGPIYATTMAQDNFIFIDGIRRVWNGDMPHVDFHTGLGALTFYGPAIGSFFGVTDEFRSFTLFYTFVVFASTGFALYVGLTRLDAFASIVLLVYVAAVVGAPSNIGVPQTEITFAMWYNRLGWGMLLSGALLAVPPRRRVPGLDAAAILVLMLAAFYLKITIVLALGLVFAAAFLTRPHLRQPLVLAGIGVGAALAGIEVMTGGLNTAYLRDLSAARDSNGTFFFDARITAANNWFEIAVAGLALYVATRRRRDLFGLGDFVLFAAVLLASLHVINNNYQQHGLVALLAVPIACYAALRRDIGEAGGAPFPPVLVLSGAIVAFYALPEAYARHGALEAYRANNRSAAYDFPVPEAMKGMIMAEGRPDFAQRFVERGNDVMTLEDLALYLRGRAPLQEVLQTEYAYMIANGVAELKAVMDRFGRGPVINLDFSNPFSAIMDLQTPHGDYAWYHWNKNISDAFHEPPERVFADAAYVMEPKMPVTTGSLRFLLRIYGGYVREHYRVIAERPLWRIWMKLPPEEAPRPLPDDPGLGASLIRPATAPLADGDEASPPGEASPAARG